MAGKEPPERLRLMDLLEDIRDCARAAAAEDGVITDAEAELDRAIANALGFTEWHDFGLRKLLHFIEHPCQLADWVPDTAWFARQRRELEAVHGPSLALVGER